MQLLSKAIHEILTTDTDILETVGSGNIWHSKIPQRNTSGTDAPPELSIYYYTFAVTPNDTKSGASQVDDHMVRVCIVGNDDETMYDVARYVRYALDRVTPGTYGGIPIDGIRFLNAGFDPEGSFELENQSWVLEFKVRVIDNDIRVPGGTPAEFATPLWWYSESEQEWPYGKWLNGERIYWKTVLITSASTHTTYDPVPSGGSTEDGYEILSAEPERIIDARVWHHVDTTESEISPQIYWQSPGLATVAFKKATDGKIYMPSDLVIEGNSISVTIWYIP